MPRGVLTLEPGSRFWFEGDMWEVDTFLGDQARLRRGVSVRSVSTSALLAAATPLDEPADDPDGEGDPFALPAGKDHVHIQVGTFGGHPSAHRSRQDQTQQVVAVLGSITGCYVDKQTTVVR